MQENFAMIKMSEISLTPMTKMRLIQCKMLFLRKTKSLNTPCSPCVHFKKIRFNDSDRCSVRILFGLNQLNPFHFHTNDGDTFCICNCFFLL